MSSTPTEVLRAEVERYPWYHTLELGDGVVTQAMFDHRPVLDRYRCLPISVGGVASSRHDGPRCLDPQSAPL